ncbi:MAG: hypothetical protein ACUVX9_13520 [Anaerolineae bacterium]
MGRILRIVVAVVLLGLFGSLPAQGADPNLLKNGSFEDGFTNGVGTGWSSFNNGGRCSYGFAADTRKPVVWDGNNAQLIRMETGSSIEADRYAGIYQVVKVAPGATYRLTLHGMVRTSEGSVQASGYGYRLQWAVDQTGSTDWTAVPASSWHELPWYEWPLESPGYLETASADIVAQGSTLTLFVRAWRKWGIENQQADYFLDGISLVGPAPAAQPTATPASGGQLPQTGLGPTAAPVLGVLMAALAVGANAMRRRWRRG